MKRILMIAPSTFPVNGAESIVNIKLLRALSESGNFEIDLVSKRNKWHNYPSDTIESYGVNLKSLHIIEVDNKITIVTAIQHFLSLLMFGTVFKGSHWAYKAQKIAVNLAKQGQYDYVLTKEENGALVGYYLKRKFGLKWVATWNDPCPSCMYPPPYGKGIIENPPFFTKKFIGIIRQTDIHIFPSERLARYMQPITNASSEKLILAPHVTFDVENHQIPENQKLRLIHSGNLGSPRNPESFLYGLKQFIDKDKISDIEFSILGIVNDDVKGLIVQLGLEHYVTLLPPVEYKSSLKILGGFDVAVIIEADCDEGIYLPTKVSDFMQSGIPIFSISPKNGTLNDLFNNGNVPYFAPVDNIGLIEEAIRVVYNSFKEKKIRSNVIPDNYTSMYIGKLYEQL